MSGFSDEISKFFEVTSSLIAEVKNSTSQNVDQLLPYEERVQVHLELCSVIVTHLQLQGQSSAMGIFNQLADLAKGLSLDIVSASCNENTTRAACGRPKFIITLEQAKFLRRMTYTWRQIASFLNVSVSKISRRRTELGYLEENE